MRYPPRQFARGLALVAEAPWSAAEWAVALFCVELLQAQIGRHPCQVLTYHFEELAALQSSRFSK